MAVDIFEKFLSSSIIEKFLVSLKVKKRKRLSAKLFLFWLIFYTTIKLIILSKRDLLKSIMEILV